MKGFSKLFSILMLIVSFCATQNLDACTTFCLKKDSAVIVGKNLDWSIGDGFIVINKKNVSKFSLVNPGKKPVHWISNYGSITFNQFGVELPLGGMNEAGLIVEELSYSPSVYPTNDSLCSLNEMQWLQYQLDNFSNVEEVIQNLSAIQITKFMFGLHYFVSDRSGSSAVIEFLDGKSVFYSGADLPVAVLSNNSYRNSIKYLKFHQGFGGDMIPRNGSGSQERFVRTAMLLKNYDDSYPADYAFSILENVKQQDTQWSIVYDPVHLSIKFKIKDQLEIQQLDFKSVKFSDSKSGEYYRLGSSCTSQELLRCFNRITRNKNNALLKLVFNKLVKFEEMDRSTATHFMDRISDYQLMMKNIE